MAKLFIKLYFQILCIILVCLAYFFVFFRYCLMPWKMFAFFFSEHFFFWKKEGKNIVNTYFFFDAWFSLCPKIYHKHLKIFFLLQFAHYTPNI